MSKSKNSNHLKGVRCLNNLYFFVKYFMYGALVFIDLFLVPFSFIYILNIVDYVLKLVKTISLGLMILK